MTSRTRTITFLDGGGTIDTNGINLALANSVGSGIGGLTKIGAGNLTLNAAATYTGATTVTGGTLTVGANNATGSRRQPEHRRPAATLALGTNSITAGLVHHQRRQPAITGTGTITASTGFFFNHTGDTHGRRRARRGRRPVQESDQRPHADRPEHLHRHHGDPDRHAQLRQHRQRRRRSQRPRRTDDRRERHHPHGPDDGDRVT